MTHIWVPKFKIIEPKDPLGLSTKVQGEVRLCVIKPGIKEPRIDTGWFKNLVLDGGLDLLGTSTISSATTRCFVGSSNTPPSASQTSLVNPIASTTTSFSPSISYALEGTYGVDARKSITIFRQFSTGAAAGTIREVGFTTSADSGGTNLFSRALVTDGAGNPTDIVVLSDEILQVTYKISVYFPTEDIEGSFDLSGTEIGYIARVPSVPNSGNGFTSLYNAQGNTTVYSGGTFGAIGANISGGSLADLGNASLAAYTNGNHYRDMSVPASLSQGNVSGGSFDKIGFSSGSAPMWKFLLDTPVPKDNTKVMTLNFRRSWARKT